MAKFIKKINIPFLILFLIGMAFVLRIYKLQDDLFFGYEQARDLFLVKEIVAGDIKLLGPSTDVAGVFHGVLYFYILLPLFLIFKGNPFLIQSFLVLINSLAIFFLYKAVRQYHGSRVAKISVLVYSISYSSIIYSRWLSNTNLIPAVAITLYYFLIESRQDWRFLFGVVISWGALFHFHEVVGVALVLPTMAFIYFEKIKLSLKQVAQLLSVLGVSLITYIVYEVKNEFQMTKVLYNFISSQGLGSRGLSFAFGFIEEVSDSLYPLSPRTAFVLYLVLAVVTARELLFKRKELLSIFFLIAPPVFFGLAGIVPLRHFYITVPVFLSIILALVIDRLLKRQKLPLAYLILSLIIFGNLLGYVVRISKNKPSFIYHAQRTYLGDLKNLIDYVYQDAGGRPFSYDYYSIPYWKEEVWQYMFEWYGKPKYGYLPNYDRTEVFYILIEPNETIPVHLDNWYGEYKKELELLDVYQSGKLKAEKRREKVIDGKK